MLDGACSPCSRPSRSRLSPRTDGPGPGRGRSGWSRPIQRDRGLESRSPWSKAAILVLIGIGWVVLARPAGGTSRRPHGWSEGRYAVPVPKCRCSKTIGGRGIRRAGGRRRRRLLGSICGCARGHISGSASSASPRSDRGGCRLPPEAHRRRDRSPRRWGDARSPACWPCVSTDPRQQLDKYATEWLYDECVTDTDEDWADAAFHALAHRTRRDILRRVLAGEHSVSALAAAYPMSFCRGPETRRRPATGGTADQAAQGPRATGQR